MLSMKKRPKTKYKWQLNKVNNTHYCSKCQVSAAYTKNGYEYLSPFCPWCGTELTEVEVESDDERN